MGEKNNVLTIQNYSEIKSDVITTLVDYLHTIIDTEIKQGCTNPATINSVSKLGETISFFLD